MYFIPVDNGKRKNRPDSASFLLPRLNNDGSMENDWQHKMFGVSY
jgi:hypothetical protein